MRPRQLRHEGVCRVLLQNHTPIVQTANLAVETPQGGLYVDAAQKQITLVPGQQGVVDFYIQPIKQPFTGRMKSWPFAIRLTPTAPQGQAPSAMEGQVAVASQLPLWLGLLLVILLLALCGLSLWTLTSLPALNSLLSAFSL